jgi:hypothetical protein
MAEFFNRQWRLPNNENKSKQSNYSLSFGSGSDYVLIGSVPTLFISSWSISFWFKAPSIGNTNGTIISRYRGGNATGDLEITSSNGQIYVETGGGFPSTGTNMPVSNPPQIRSVATTLDDGNWHHIAFSLDYTSGTSTRSLYVDGSLDISDSTTTPAEWVSQTENLLFGVLLPPSNSQYNGSIDSIAIFNYTLSASQVTTLYGSSSTGIGNPMILSPKPAAYYPLGDQDAFNGANYLVPNSSLKDYVFKFNSNRIDLGLESSLGLGGASKYSTSLWFKKSSNSTSCLWGYNYGDANGSGWYYWLNSGNLRIATGKNGISSGFGYYEISANELPIDEWQHVVVVFNGTLSAGDDRIKVYHNGTNAAGTYSNSANFPATLPNGNSASNRNLYLGQLQLGGGSFSYNYDGELSNVQQWDTDLSLANASTLYNNGQPLMTGAQPQEANLKFWYKLDASEVYNNTTTEWTINQVQAPYQSSVFCPNVSGQTVTDYLQVTNYSGTTGKTAASWSFWYNASEANNQSGALSGSVAEFKRNAGGQYAGMEFTLYTEVGGVNFTFSTKTTNFGGRYMDMPAAGNSAGIQGIGDWVNIVLVYDGNDPVPLAAGGFAPQSGSIRAYANGAQGFVPGGSNAYNGVYPAEGTIRTGSLIFGGGNFASRHMSASLSNYATWDKALTQAEVNEIVNNGQPKDLSTHSASSNLISWWKLNNLTTGLVDTIGGYNASIVGSNSYTNVGPVSQLNGTSFGMTQANLIQSDLSFTSGYSPYALDFDGINDSILVGNSPIVTGVFTISMWIKRTSLTSPESAASQYLIQKDDISTNRVYNCFLFTSTGKLGFFVSSTGSYDSTHRIDTLTAINDTNWHNVVFVNNGNGVVNQVYVDGAEASYSTQGTGVSTLHSSTINARLCGSDFYAPANFYGSMSNVSMWNAALASSQVSEIYNEGVPSNLNNHSAYSNLVSWWQLGSNTSWVNPYWIALDEKGTNNGQSQNVAAPNNMGESAIVGGVGSYANGLSSGMGGDEVIGDAPYSTANSLSVNMDVLDRVTDTPS